MRITSSTLKDSEPKPAFCTAQGQALRPTLETPEATLSYKFQARFDVQVHASSQNSAAPLPPPLRRRQRFILKAAAAGGSSRSVKGEHRLSAVVLVLPPPRHRAELHSVHGSKAARYGVMLAVRFLQLQITVWG
jgi:hypothetical protein